MVRQRGLLLEIGEQVARTDVPELVQRLSDKGKVLLFRTVEGYACGLVANLVPSHEVFRAAFNTDNPYAYFLEGVKRSEKKVRLAQRGVETIEVGDRDLLDLLPILKHYDGDSAPFITTGVVSSVDPETGVVGRGIHRMEYRGKNRMGVVLLNPPLTDIYAKYKARGERMPLTVTIGVDPVIFLAMALKVPTGVDKLELAGGLKGKGIPVIDSFDAAIDVPAGAEFYLEGRIDPDDLRQDGPLGEISGYYMTVQSSPTVVVHRISHRPSPIYHALLPTSAEGDTYLTFVSRAHVEERAKTLFPFISDIAFAPKTFGSSIILSVKPVEQAKVRNLLLFLLAFPMIKKVVVVDEDVNPYDPRDVEWAVVTRCKADRDMMVIPGLQGQPIDPTAEEGFVVTKVGINATVRGKHIDERARVSVGNPGEIERIMRSIGGAGCE